MSENQPDSPVAAPPSEAASAQQPVRPTAAAQPAELQQVISTLAPELPPEKRKMIVAAVSQVTYAGPIPPPEMLARYAQVIPNGGDRIMKMAEQQASHRINLEATVIGNQQRLASRGQVFGLIIGLAALAASVGCVFAGSPAVGGVIGGTTVVGLVTAFVLGKSHQKDDLSKKRPAVPEAQQQHRQLPQPNQKKKNRRRR